MEPSLRALGRRLAAAQDERLQEAFDFERARSRLLETSRGVHRPALGIGLAAALVMTLAYAALWLVTRSAPLEFHVGGDALSANVGEWIAAPPNQSVPIAFSDGTTLTLSESARARVVDVDTRGASVIVERGELHAKVVHRPKASWQVFVGPFQVRVTGTAFDVAWLPDAERFSLTLREGSVVVTGPSLGAGRTLHAGEKLGVSPKAGELRVETPEPAVNPRVAPPVQVPSADTGGEARALAAETSTSTRPAPEAPRAAPKPVDRAAQFRKLALESRYKEALAEAERIGFDGLCETANADDVMLLADSARLAGDASKARRAYERVRQRFPGHDAGQAAFFLGRLAVDQRADYAEAARYFQLSLAEQPGGPLAREAAGRLIEAKFLSGDTSGAKAASQQYLDRYPDGPHAKAARRWLAVP